MQWKTKNVKDMYTFNISLNNHQIYNRWAYYELIFLWFIATDDPMNVVKTNGLFHDNGKDFEIRKKRESPPASSTTKDLCSRKNRIACVSYFTDYPDKKAEVFNTLPSNCEELQLLGHQTSGFYLVKGIEDNLAKIDNIYCEFRWNNYRKNHSKYDYIKKNY